MATADSREAAAGPSCGKSVPGSTLDDFVLGEELGQGAYGLVFRCTEKASGVSYAIKTISIEHATRHGGVQQVINEKEALETLNSPGHPNLIRLHAALRDAQCLYLVLELAPGGELFRHIRRLGACSLLCARWLSAELINALEYMHGRGLVHRDLKPSNILLDDVGHLKLVDFGSSLRLGAAEHCHRFVGTPQYISPEVLDNRPATASVDLWALGCILYQMLAGEPPFTAPSDYLLIRQIEELDFSYPPNFPPAAASLVGALIARHPSARLGAPSAGGYAALRAHPFFTGVAPPIDFATVGATPPPPLAPPPPFPAIDVDDRVLNSALAGHQLSAEERAQLLQSQAGTRWASYLEPGEVIILATRVLKRRFLSVKSRQLVLVDTPPGASAPRVTARGSGSLLPALSSPPASAAPLHGARLFYADPAPQPAPAADVPQRGEAAPPAGSQASSQGPAPHPLAPAAGQADRSSAAERESSSGGGGGVKGSIPLTHDLDVELGQRAAFYIRPHGERGRTFLLEDATGDEDLAELWVRTLLRLKQRMVDAAEREEDGLSSSIEQQHNR